MENSTENKQDKRGKLFLVSTPIGNFDDITMRAIKVLKACDIVICEEIKEGARTLKNVNITKKMEPLNEQNEAEQTPMLLEWLRNGMKLAMISDAGTPLFADPGLPLVQACIRENINIEVVPGASSIMTALVRSGFSLKQFLYAGFLSRQRDERRRQVERLAQEARTVAVLETPYRLMPLLEAASDIMPGRHAYVGCNLTLPYETHHYGTFRELMNKFKKERFKGEFVIVFEGVALSEFEQMREQREQRGFSQERRFGSKPYGKPSGRGYSRPGGKPPGKPYQRSGDKPYGRSGDKPYGRSGDKPYGRSGDKPYGRSGDKPRGGSYDRYGEKSGGKSYNRYGEKPSGKSYGKPGDRKSGRGGKPSGRGPDRKK